MSWSIPDIIMDRRLQWLGYLGRMKDERLLKQVVFVELKKKAAISWSEEEMKRCRS